MCAALACALLVAACGGSEAEPTPAPTPGATATPEPTPPPVPISFNQFSFSLDLDGVYSISTSPVLDTLPNDKSGSLLWARAISRYALSWRPREDFKDEEERNNQHLIALDRSINLLQSSNPNIILSEMSLPATETLAGFNVTYKTFQIKAGETISKGLASTFLCTETDKDFLFGIVFTEDPKASLAETLSKFKCVKRAS